MHHTKQDQYPILVRRIKIVHLGTAAHILPFGLSQSKPSTRH